MSIPLFYMSYMSENLKYVQLYIMTVTKMPYTMKTCDELESDFLSSFQQLRTLMCGYDIDNLKWIMKEHKSIIKRAKADGFVDNDEFNFVLAEAAHHSLFHGDTVIGPKMETIYAELLKIHYAMEQACLPANAAKIAEAKAAAATVTAARVAKRAATIAKRNLEKKAALKVVVKKIAADEAAGIGYRLRTRNTTC